MKKWLLIYLFLGNIGFSNPNIDIIASGDPYSPKLATRLNGEIYLSFRAGDHTLHIYKSTNSGYSWDAFYKIDWYSIGGSLIDFDIHVAEGNSNVLFVLQSVAFNPPSGFDIKLTRLDLNTGIVTNHTLASYPQSSFIVSPQIISNATNLSDYRLRSAWIVRDSKDYIYFSLSNDYGLNWTAPQISYTESSGGLTHLSLTYGNNEYWISWSWKGNIYASTLTNPASRRAVSTNPHPHHRPIIAAGCIPNNLGLTTLMIVFYRESAKASDMGSYFSFSQNSGHNWSSEFVIGSDPDSTQEIKPYVSYCKNSNKFYFSYMSRENVGSQNAKYKIKGFYSTFAKPDIIVPIRTFLNSDTLGGSFEADPYIISNTTSPFYPIVAWRHWQGSGDGKIQLNSNIVLSNSEYNNEMPEKFSLSQNYPNPFNSSTKIKFTIPLGLDTRHGVSLRVYDVLGREVATLVNGYKEAGYYEATWIAPNVSSAVYYYKLKAGSFVQVKKMILMR